MAHYRRKRQSKLGSYPMINVVFSTTLALLVVGLFGLLMLHAARLTDIIRENVKIQVYLHKNISESESIRISQLLSKKDFVLKKNGHAQLKFLSKEDAAQEFTKATGENFLQVLDENPLRDVYVVNVAPSYQGRQQLQAIKREVEAIIGVFEVDYVAGFVASVNRNIARLGTVLAAFSVILLVVVSVLINNTIRLAVYSQRFLVRSMHLVGATAAFIRRPFLGRAVLIGLIAGTIANIFLVLLSYAANRQIEALVKLQEPIRIFMLLGLILLLGVFISFMGTYRAINKYLNMSLDDLY
ncbi:MAG TPA: cell division protein [Amoebophilaceae bacterium]|nr:cell division protein [Amoebophilaceae bacterium]